VITPLNRLSRQFVWLILPWCFSAVHLHGQQPSDSENSAAPSDSPQAESESPNPEPPPLISDQKLVAERFSRLEILLLRSADLESGENPARAALLQQAVQLSKQADLTRLLSEAAARLEQGQYSEAIEKQKLSRESLKRLLELLQSENREQRIREERDEVRRWIEETDRLLRLQSSLRGRTEGGQAIEEAAQDQQKLSDQAGEIADELKSQQPAPETAPTDATNPEDGEPQQGEPQQGEPQQGEPQQGEPQQGEPQQGEPQQGEPQQGEPQQGEPQQGEPQQGEPQQGEPQQGEPQQGEPQQGEPQQGEPQQGEPQQGEPQQGEPQQGEPQQGEPQQGEPQPPRSPSERAQQKIEEAKRNMQEAQERLEEAQRQGAVEKQRQAEDRLREAIEQLEEILRQLREEEVERSLASLETRLRRMLDMQNRVLEETSRLQAIGDQQADRQVQIAANKLSLDELKILAEGERALLLLRDEGSSAAFPEAVQQLNIDIQSVADRLQAADVSPLTTIIEQEIVNSLEEMVEALVQVQKENREKKQTPAGEAPPAGEPGDQPLVDKLAELRLIRTLQLRINKRTDALSNLLSDPTDPTGQASAEDILEQLQGLGERQASIQSVTRDIVVGKGE
jgi:hypothetical protein